MLIDSTNKYKIIVSATEPEEGMFEVDELIAPVIARLNKRGYQTKYSCSGHHYSDKVLINGIEGYQFYGYMENMEAYILFEKVYDFPPLPSGWENEIFMTNDEDEEYDVEPHIPRTRLSYELTPDIDVWDFYQYQIEIFREFDNWVKSLPNIKE